VPDLDGGGVEQPRREIGLVEPIQGQCARHVEIIDAEAEAGADLREPMKPAASKAVLSKVRSRSWLAKP
jgi:hypothetical protein